MTLFYCVVFPYYWWTAVSSGPSGIPDYYNQLTDSFLAGHLDMLYQPPKGLLRLANPYLSSENGAYQHQYHDLILWHGHFYIGWGVTPVVTLFLPWRALGVGDMPVSLAAVIFACVGLFFAVLLFLTLLDRFLPGTSLWTVAVALAALALCSVVPFMLRRPAVYEVEIISGYAFLMLALYLLASGCLRSRLVAWRLGLGSLCLGLAFGARAVLIPVTLLAAALVFVVVLHDTANRRTKQVLSYGSLIFVPLGVVLLLALAYNYARFGSPFQYGNEYSLGGVYTRNLHLFSLRYLRPGLTYMVFKPIYFTLSFPYVGLTNFPLPASLPAGYSIEAIGGFLDTTPFVVLLGGIAFVGLRDRMSREFRAVLLALTALGVLGLLTVAFAIWDVTQEYEADYLSLLLIPALLVWSSAPRWAGLGQEGHEGVRGRVDRLQLRHRVRLVVLGLLRLASRQQPGDLLDAGAVHELPPNDGHEAPRSPRPRARLLRRGRGDVPADPPRDRCVPTPAPRRCRRAGQLLADEARPGGGLADRARRSRHRAQRGRDSSCDRRRISFRGPRAARGRGGPHPDHGGRSGAGADQGFEFRPGGVTIIR